MSVITYEVDVDCITLCNIPSTFIEFNIFFLFSLRYF